ncbi:MAG: HlyD family efflux transporter periplasmic adaptor subunit [Peptococcaceae bacterium]|nr:HlyD family efflux transporter periplasmic adaptor subunit [Peptococcaceae bacterium]
MQFWQKARAKIKSFRPGNLKKLNRKKKILIAVIILALIILSISLARCSRGEEPVMNEYIETVVQKGNVRDVITATGKVEFAQTMPLSFEVGGTIQEIMVKEGDVVDEGQPLMRLETATLEQALKEASENFESERSNYEQKIEGLERQLKSALIEAEKRLLNTKKEADPYYLENQYHLAELNVKAAGERLANAQSSGETDTYSLQVALSQAQLNLIDAKYRRDGGAAKELQLAQAEYEAALKAWQGFQKGVSPEYLSAKASLTASETKLVEAQENLNNAILKAPMAGTVVACEAELYSSVSEEKAVMSLVSDPNVFKVIASVDQTEISRITVGQKAEITLDTLPGELIAGTVAGVSLTGTDNHNVITYDITIDVDAPTTILRDRMNVNVAVILQQVTDVLVIPSQAVTSQDGTAGVLLPHEESGQAGESAGAGAEQAAQGAHTFVPIEIGLDDGTNVEVKSGLSEGQTILMPVFSLGEGGFHGPRPMGPGW